MINRQNVALIGMPGVGKSTVGVLLAKRLGYGFIDTDILIQSRENKQLRELISELGVIGFRKLEASHITTLDCRNHVIATGGSVVYQSEAMRHLAALGTVVFLDLGLAPLKARLDSLDARGVVRNPGQTLDDLFFERMPLYRKWAGLTFSCDGRTADHIKESIASSLFPTFP
jgi:shikimate kinase